MYDKHQGIFFPGNFHFLSKNLDEPKNKADLENLNSFKMKIRGGHNHLNVEI